MGEATARRTGIQGHRGWRAAWPENTLAGFAAALAAGVDAIELDVGLTRDGAVAVCHDPNLDPDLTRGPDGHWVESGPALWTSTLAALRRFDVGRARPGGPTATRFPGQCAVDGQRVPTLAEVFALGGTARLEVEIKTDPHRPALTASPATIVDAVLETARAAGTLDRLGLRAFDWRALRHARSHLPPERLTWLTDATTEAAPALWWDCDAALLPALARSGGAGGTWAPDHAGLTADRIAAAHAAGLHVAPWTVNDAAEMRRLAACGVAAICTDDIVAAQAVLRR